jgi:myo-inositol-1(or 4)-monophosphatase
MWDKELQVASAAAREAGEILKKRFGGPLNVRKKGVIDLVTDADLQAEKAILRLIRTRFPSDGILAEESGSQGQSPGRTWVIDPLDGTTNFAHGFPFFAVSIALEVAGKIALGIVYNPHLEEYFEAARGSGASLNGRPITVSNTTEIGDSLLATGFPYDIQDNGEDILELFARVTRKAQGVRRPGSAALDLCYVACGRLDGFWEKGLNPWDTAAGSVIVREAGGRLATYSRTDYTPYEKTVVAANPVLLEEMLRVINSND